MVRRFSWLVAVATLVLGGHAWAAKAPTPKLAHFRLAGDEIAVPMPAGFCEVTGKYADQSQMMAAADNQNVTLLSLASCAEMAAGGPLRHYAYIKTPKTMLGVRATLAEVLAQFGAIPDSEMRSAIEDAKIAPKIEEGLHTITGKDAKIHSAIVPVALDHSGYYLAGVIDIAVGDRSGSIAAAVSVTAAKGHLFTYNLYGPDLDAPGLKALLDRTKTETQRIVAANQTSRQAAASSSFLRRNSISFTQAIDRK